jgi:DNA adenine methylase
MRELLAGRIFVFNEDCLKFLKKFDSQEDFLYLDPPYFKKGADLYNHFFCYEDHKNLKNFLANKQGWLLSYDNCQEILDIYNDFNILSIDCQYSISGQKKTLNYTKEIIIIPNAA